MDWILGVGGVLVGLLFERLGIPNPLKPRLPAPQPAPAPAPVMPAPAPLVPGLPDFIKQIVDGVLDVLRKRLPILQEPQTEAEELEAVIERRVAAALKRLKDRLADPG